MAAALLLPLGAQLHALSHAVAALHQAEKSGLAMPHSAVCEQCLLFAAADAAPPTHSVSLRLPAPSVGVLVTFAPLLWASTFSAYTSRAPPPAH